MQGGAVLCCDKHFYLSTDTAVEAEGAERYRKLTRECRMPCRRQKEDWILGTQCKETETCLNPNNNKRVHQRAIDLISEKIYNYPGQVWEIANRRTEDSQQMNRIHVLLRTNTTLRVLVTMQFFTAEDLQPIFY